MVDYLIVLLQRRDQYVHQMFQQIPINNPKCDELYNVLGKAYDEKLWRKIQSYLSWKQPFPLREDVQDTFYAKLLEEKLD